MELRPYQKLVAWQEAHALCLSVYKATKLLPADERFRLVSQMCRSAYGVPTNLAEGNVRRSNKDKAHFFEIALSSLEELHYQCVLSRDLAYFTAEKFNEFEDQIRRTSFLIHKLRLAFLA